MNRFGSFRNAAAVVVLGGLIAAVVAVATASAAPSKKNYTVKVAVTKPTVGAVNPQNFTVTITNDRSSNTTLGSVNVTLPTGFTADSASTSRDGWAAGTTIVTDSQGTSTIQLRSTSNALAPTQVMVVQVHVSSPSNLPITAASLTGCAGTATWSSSAKQSNDYNGTNNWFTLISSAADLTPLGSFAWDPIGTTVNGVFAPAIYTTRAANYPSPSPTVRAFDTCGAPKTDYSGPTTLAYSGAPDKVTVSGPTWSTTPTPLSRVGTVAIAPTIAETSRKLTLTDNLTGISGASDPFDTQDRICTVADASCTWGNGNSINASSNGPSQGSLGVGFNPVVQFSCNGANNIVPLGQTVITIAPHGTSASSTNPYQVTIVYSKQASGTGSANAFVFCISSDDGANWTTLPSCSAAAGTTVDCVFDQKRVTGGALQVILSLIGDPYVGGK